MKSIDFKTLRVTGVELSNVLGLSKARIAQLEDNLTIRRQSDKKFILQQAVMGYVDSFRKKRSRVESNYEEARARKMEAAADIEEMNAKKRKGELVEISDVVDIVEAEYSIVRQRLFAIPNKIALDVFSCENPQEVQDLLLTHTNEALSELRYDIGRETADESVKDSETSSENISS